MSGHSHGHEMEGGWEHWLANPMLRVLLGALAGAALATIIGILVLWPDGSGRDQAIAEADEIGLITSRLEATIDSVTDGPCSYSTEENPIDCRVMIVIPTEGPDAGALVALPEFPLGIGAPVPPGEVGDGIILGYEPDTNFYFYADHDRRSALWVLIGLFAVLVVVLGRVRGALALAAMALTVAMLIGFVAPSVLDGNDPVLVSVVAASAIAFVSLYLTHGVNLTTTVALAGTLSTLLLILIISWAFFELSQFTGLATEEGLTLPVVAGNVNLASLLLGGAVIGALGALDDVTVTQVATVAEVHHRDPTLGRTELITSGIRVGREHIAATVNTLLLAYVGASMPLLLLFVISTQSLEMIANSELIAVEIVRTLCGSIGLIAAVPITTWLTANLLVADAGPATAEDDPPPTEPPQPTEPLQPTEPPRPTEPKPKWEDFAPSDDVDGF